MALVALVALGAGSVAPSARAAGPLPAFARGRGDVDVSGDGRFGLFAGGRELVIWELATGQRRHRARLASAAWEIHASPDGETVALVAPGRFAEVKVLNGRVVVDQPAPRTVAGVTEVAWAPDGSELVLVGLELAELAPGPGTPIAYFEPKLGYVARQIRVPGLVATRGAAVLPDGGGVVVGTPRDLLFLGQSLVDVRTARHAGTADVRVIGAFAQGVLVVQRGRLEVLEPKTAALQRTIEIGIAEDERLLARPLGRWLLAIVDGAKAMRVIDLQAGTDDALPLATLGRPRVVTPLADALVAFGRQVVILPQGP
ncbi:MAG: hypothetical protein IT385_20350 [Deltaproteobacteria bacterium]|nr:hypothetical protein [Deltaproteobacteria bacterium]